MNITPINYIQNNHSKIQNFSGLWGKTSRNSDFEQALGIPKIQEFCYYYPFQDEKQEDINKIVQNIKSAVIDESSGTAKYKINECRICATLPFTEKQYSEYSSVNEKSTISELTKKIHSFVTDKYKTNEFGPSQKPAENDTVARRLNREA